MLLPFTQHIFGAVTLYHDGSNWQLIFYLAPGSFSYVLHLILLMFSHELQTQPHHPFFIPAICPNKPLFMKLNYLEPHIFYPDCSLPTSNDMTPGN